MISPLGELMKRPAHDDTADNVVSLLQVFLFPGRSSFRHIQKCAHSQKMRDELRCIFQKVEIERRQRSASVIGKHRGLTEHHMTLRVRIRGLLALVSSTSSKKRMKFVNGEFNTAKNTRRCALLKTRREELTRANFMG